MSDIRALLGGHQRAAQQLQAPRGPRVFTAIRYVDDTEDLASPPEYPDLRGDIFVIIQRFCGVRPK